MEEKDWVVGGAFESRMTQIEAKGTKERAVRGFRALSWFSCFSGRSGYSASAIQWADGGGDWDGGERSNQSVQGILWQKSRGP